MHPIEKKICVVTGAQGWLGRCVVRHFEGQGWIVRQIVRRPQGSHDGFQWTLGEALPDRALAGAAAVIHAAYDFASPGWREIQMRNVEGSRLVFRSAAEAGIAKIIFVSSMAAFAGCRSLY